MLRGELTHYLHRIRGYSANLVEINVFLSRPPIIMRKG